MTDKTFRQHIKKCGDLKAKINELTALYDEEPDIIYNNNELRDYLINYLKMSAN